MMMKRNVIYLLCFAEKAKSTLTPQGLIDWKWELSSRASSQLFPGEMGFQTRTITTWGLVRS